MRHNATMRSRTAWVRKRYLVAEWRRRRLANWSSGLLSSFQRERCSKVLYAPSGACQLLRDSAEVKEDQ